MNRITLYSKPECPLCEKAERLLRKLQRELTYEIEVVDITKEAALFECYCFDIPVILLDGVERFCGRISAEELRATFRGLHRAR